VRDFTIEYIDFEIILLPIYDNLCMSIENLYLSKKNGYRSIENLTMSIEDLYMDATR